MYSSRLLTGKLPLLDLDNFSVIHLSPETYLLEDVSSTTRNHPYVQHSAKHCSSRVGSMSGILAYLNRSIFTQPSGSVLGIDGSQRFTSWISQVFLSWTNSSWVWRRVTQRSDCLEIKEVMLYACSSSIYTHEYIYDVAGIWLSGRLLPRTYKKQFFI